MEQIIQLICQIGGIQSIAPDEMYYGAGFPSLRLLELLLALEDHYGIKIPDEQFIAARTPRDIEVMVRRLQKDQLVCSAL